MAGFPVLAIIHLVFGLILFVYWTLSFVILYHLTRFGIGVQPKRLVATFFLLSMVITVGSIVSYTKIDFNVLVS